MSGGVCAVDQRHHRRHYMQVSDKLVSPICIGRPTTISSCCTDPAAAHWLNCGCFLTDITMLRIGFVVCGRSAGHFTSRSLPQCLLHVIMLLWTYWWVCFVFLCVAYMSYVPVPKSSSVVACFLCIETECVISENHLYVLVFVHCLRLFTCT